jgi:hypothetical protein
MSFLKKLTKEFEGLKASHDEKKKHEGEAPHGQYGSYLHSFSPSSTTSKASSTHPSILAFL